MAAPIVSGIVGIVVSVNKGIKPTQLLEQMEETGAPNGNIISLKEYYDGNNENRCCLCIEQYFGAKIVLCLTAKRVLNNLIEEFLTPLISQPSQVGFLF